MIVETDVPTEFGGYLYSDIDGIDGVSTLNHVAQIPMLGIVAGVARVALGIIHSVIHLIHYAMSQKHGHLFHIVKGGAEILRGAIEATPFLGRSFAWSYMQNWWLIKIMPTQ